MLNGPEKAAVLLSLVGEDTAAEIVGELDEKELFALRRGMQRAGFLEEAHVALVFEEVSKQLSHAVLPEETSDYLRRVLSRALGPERATMILNQLFEDDGSSGIDALREMDSKTLGNFLKEEHPQTIAFVLAHLYPGHAGEVLSLLDEAVQTEVAFRITQLNRTPPEVLEEVSNLLRHEIRQIRGKDVGGVRPVAEILNNVNKTTEERVLAGLAEIDPELADKVRDLMFVFEDLANMEDRDFQQLIREIERDKWAVALRTATPAFRKKVYANMSERAAGMLKEEIENMGPVKLRDVEKVQREILAVARELEAEGKIALSAKGREDVLV
jgi:flagellar motor switch protein FliG